MDSSIPFVQLDGVAIRAGAATILRGVDLTVRAGEAVGLFGANGAGKTTLLRVMATLLRPSAGKATILGADVAAEERYAVRRRIGMVGHVPGLFPELTLEENLDYAARIAGYDGDVVRRTLVAVGLGGAAGRRAEACSHGMQRRAEFARLILMEPDLVLLDEPHAALDVEAVDLVNLMVKRVKERNGAAVLVSHDRDRVMEVADRSVELIGGRLVA